MVGKKRSFTRHPIHLPVKVRTPDGWREMNTLDVSRRGIFVSTEDPIPAHRIAQMKIEMPTGSVIDAMGHVRRVVEKDSDDGHPPGMGIEFFVMSKEAEDEWDVFVMASGRDAQPRPDIATYHAATEPELAAEVAVEAPQRKSTETRRRPQVSSEPKRPSHGTSQRVQVRSREDSRDHSAVASEPTDSALEVLQQLSAGRSGRTPSETQGKASKTNRIQVDPGATAYEETSAELVDLARKALVGAARRRSGSYREPNPTPPLPVSENSGSSFPPPIPDEDDDPIAALLATRGAERSSSGSPRPASSPPPVPQEEPSWGAVSRSNSPSAEFSEISETPLFTTVNDDDNFSQGSSSVVASILDGVADNVPNPPTDLPERSERIMLGGAADRISGQQKSAAASSPDNGTWSAPTPALSDAKIPPLPSAALPTPTGSKSSTPVWRPSKPTVSQRSPTPYVANEALDEISAPTTAVAEPTLMQDTPFIVNAAPQTGFAAQPLTSPTGRAHPSSSASSHKVTAAARGQGARMGVSSSTAKARSTTGAKGSSVTVRSSKHPAARKGAAPPSTTASSPQAVLGPRDSRTASLFITVRPADERHLRQFMERRLAATRVFLRSNMPCFPGQLIDVAVVHPKTDAEMVVGGTIARVVQGESKRDNGFLMRFSEMDASHKKALLHFVKTGQPSVVSPTAVAGEGTATLRQLAKDQPESVEHQLNYAWSLVTQDESPLDAVEPFLAALACSPADINIHVGLSLAYALAGDAAKSYAFARSSRQLAAAEAAHSATEDH